MDYVVAVKFTHPIQHLINDCKNWVILDTGIEICEQIYQSKSWEKPRRIVIARQKIKDRPQAKGRQISLFPEEEIYTNYRYLAYVKELKYDFGFDSFNLNDFYATEAALTFAMIA